MTGIDEVQLRHGAATDTGAVREVNEDAYLAEPPVFVVADGMGGHDRGDIASGIVAEEFGALAREGYDPAAGEAAVAAVLERCRQRIAEYDEEQRAAGHADFAAGTTAVAAILVEQDDEPAWLVANLGDSRAYRLAEGRLSRVSVDHSLVQEMINAGRISEELAAVHPDRHVITRALGGTGDVTADYFVLSLAEAPRLLLCSDGINGMIDDDEIAGILDETADPAQTAEQLVAAALAAGGHDNATAVVVDVVS